MGKFLDMLNEPIFIVVGDKQNAAAAADAFARIIEAQAKLKAAQHTQQIHYHKHIHVTMTREELRKLKEIGYDD